MKRLLLSASLIGVVFAGYSHSPQSMHSATSEAEPLGAALAASSISGGVSERAKSQPSGFQRVALRSPASGALQADGTPVASIDELFAPALPQVASRQEEAKASGDDARLIDESAMWVVVTRGAWMHKGPSVSSPVVGHQSPGKEMHLLDSRQGWYQVSDPETGERGWVYAKYYLEPIDRPGQKRVAVQTPLPPQTAAEPVQPKHAVRRVVQHRSMTIQPAGLDNTRSRGRAWGEGVASLLDRALRR
jgi:hypothetical protein